MIFLLHQSQLVKYKLTQYWIPGCQQKLKLAKNYIAYLKFLAKIVTAISPSYQISDHKRN
ncbi:hypothetical protein BV372_17185 [Nostoc sp. T09]|nr:hypothetical protein BV372_17185 [Nostoc sp. T09]